MKRMTAISGRGLRATGPLFCALALLVSGCTAPGDTSGYKPPAPLSKQEAEQQIQKIQSDPHMPEFAKKMSINTIRQKAGMPTDQTATPPGPGAAQGAPKGATH